MAPLRVGLGPVLFAPNKRFIVAPRGRGAWGWGCGGCSAGERRQAARVAAMLACCCHVVDGLLEGAGPDERRCRRRRSRVVGHHFGRLLALEVRIRVDCRGCLGWGRRRPRPARNTTLTHDNTATCQPHIDPSWPRCPSRCCASCMPRSSHPNSLLDFGERSLPCDRLPT